MTDEGTAPICQRTGCGGAATKHLVYQNSADIEEGDSDALAYIRVGFKHRNFCDEHIEGAQELFGGGVQSVDAPCHECPRA